MFTCSVNVRLGLAAKNGDAGACLPTVPAGVSGDAGTVVQRAGRRSEGFRHGQSRSNGAPAGETLGRRSASGDSRRNPLPGAGRCPRPMGEALSATIGIRPVSAPPRSLRATSVPSMSGSRRSRRIRSGPALGRDGDRFVPAGGLERPKAGCAKHFPGELPILLAVIDDQYERADPRAVRCRALVEKETSSPYPQAVPIRIVLAEDQYLVREGLRSVLETQEGLEVVSVCGDLDSLLVTVAAERPDVVVTDIRMPPGNTDEGIQAATRLRETDPEVGVVVLSQYATPGYLLALLNGGSERRGYLLKERVKDLEQLVAAIRAVAEGGSVFDPKVVETLVAENARSEESPLNELTPRERDVLREMAEGKNNAAIARALVLTERSVEKVIHSIFLKLGLTWEPAVHKRVKAVVLYLAESH